jgi:hypothetical protein
VFGLGSGGIGKVLCVRAGDLCPSAYLFHVCSLKRVGSVANLGTDGESDCISQWLCDIAPYSCCRR